MAKDLKDPARTPWIAMIGPPVLWAMQLVLNLTVVPVLCRIHKIWLMHAITILLAALAGGILARAVRTWSGLARRKTAGIDPETVSQTQFLAVVAVMISTFFFMVILATGMPPIIVSPCSE